jgi:hypothetical protein
VSSQLHVPNTAGSNSFEVINATTIRYNGVLYTDVTNITYPDGTTKTPSQLIDEAGGTTYAESELKRCFKVEGYDPDANGRHLFTVYTNNSRQTSKNETGNVPGGMWAEFFDMKGDYTSNMVLRMWYDFFSPLGVSYTTQYNATWVGFKLNYGALDTRSYVLTYQDDFLQDSVPCPPSTIDVTYMHDVKLSGVFQSLAPDGGHYYVPIKRFHLWRTTIGASGAATYRRVPVNPYSTTPTHLLHFDGNFPHIIYSLANPETLVCGWSVLDDVRDEEVTDEALQSTDWDPPPFFDAMELVDCWNGTMAVHHGNQVMFSEPYRPHAWPSKYRYPLPYEIVSKRADGNSLIVVTTGFAYRFTGAHPSVMTYAPIENTQAGRRSDVIADSDGTYAPSRAICRTPIGVVYACDDGLIAVSGGRSSLITEGLFTKEEWRLRYGAKLGRMALAYSNFKIIAYFRDTLESGFLLSLDGSLLTEFVPSQPIHSTAQLIGSDGLFAVSYAARGTNAGLYKIEDPTANRMSADWISRKVILPQPANYGCFQINGSGTVMVQITAGQQPIVTRTLTLIDGVPQMQRLPFGYREREWVIRLFAFSNAVVREFYLADKPSRLANA